MLIHFKRPFYCVKDLSQKADFSLKKFQGMPSMREHTTRDATYFNQSITINMSSWLF